AQTGDIPLALQHEPLHEAVVGELCQRFLYAPLLGATVAEGEQLHAGKLPLVEIELRSKLLDLRRADLSKYVSPKLGRRHKMGEPRLLELPDLEVVRQDDHTPVVQLEHRLPVLRLEHRGDCQVVAELVR